MLKEKIEEIGKFWDANPALYLGLHFFLGISFGYLSHYALAVPLLVLWTPFILRPLKIIQGILIIACAFLYALHRYPDQQIPKGAVGKAYFSISSVKPYQSPFHRTSIAYQGIVHCFQSEKQTFFNLPCTIYQDSDGIIANCDYLLEGELIEKGNRRYVLKPLKGVPWQKVAKTFSFADIRYRMKESLRRFLKKQTNDPKALSFLSALATGDITERTLNFEFKQIGLLHILAISGFQFALISAFFGFFLRQFLSHKATIFVLLALLSGYYFFLGPSPSVERSYLAVFFFFVGHFLKISSSGLNLLGVGLLLELLFDPLLVMNLGFELTFLCTAAILFFYQPSLRLFSLLLPKRKFSAVMEMPMLDKHGYLFASWIREALAINCAVHLVSLPALLFLFHKMSVLSLVYNLFFPFLTTINLFLLIIALILFPLFSPLGALVHQLNVWLTSATLELSSNPPIAYNYFIRMQSFSFTNLLIALAVFLFIGILLQKTIDQKLI